MKNHFCQSSPNAPTACHYSQCKNDLRVIDLNIFVLTVPQQLITENAKPFNLQSQEIEKNDQMRKKREKFRDKNRVI